MKYSEQCSNEIRNILETELEKQPISELGYRIFLINQIERFKPPVWVNGKCQKRNKIEAPYNRGQFTKGLRKLQLVYWNNWKFNTSISDETRGRLDSLIGGLYKKIGENYTQINEYYSKNPKS
jgi:hypothetical protein